jgi:alpha-tubulin suppressor-like RCC1 family protein
VQVPPAFGWEEVATGQGHTWGLRDGGELWCWGRNTENQCALGAGSPQQLRTPRKSAADAGFSCLAAAQSPSCALRDTELWCWGDHPMLFGANLSVPTDVSMGRSWADFSLHHFHLCAVTTGGQLFCVGRNAEGQLGLGDNMDRPILTLVSGGDYVRVEAGRFFTCAEQVDAGVLCFGENGNGQLGLGHTMRRGVPTLQLPPR